MNLSDGVLTGRQQGYSDQDIWQTVQQTPEYQAMRNAGKQDADIVSSLNLSLRPRDQVIADAARRHGIDPSLLSAVQQVEFGGVSRKGAKGPFQLMDETAKGLGVKDPYNFEDAAEGAAAYLQQGFNKYHNVTDALRYYHGGPSEDKWGDETNAYPLKVVRAWNKPSPTATGQQPPAGQAQPSGQPPPGVSGTLEYAPGYGPGMIEIAPPEQRRELAAVPSAPIRTQPAPPPSVDLGTLANYARMQGSQPEWGPEWLKYLSNAATLGVGQPLADWTRTQFGRLAGEAQPGVFGTATEQAGDLARARRAEFEATYPKTAALMDIGGSIPATAAAMEFGLGPAAEAGLRYARVPEPVIDYLAGRFGGPGTSLAERVGSRVVGGAIQGATGTALNVGLLPEGEEAGPAIARGAVGGAIVGPLSRLIGPITSQDRAVLSKWASDQGIQLSPAQMMDDGLMRRIYRLSEALPFSGAKGRIADAKDQFNLAVSKTIGENTTHFTTDVMGKAAARVRTELDDAENGIKQASAATGPDFQAKLQEVLQSLTKAPDIRGVRDVNRDNVLSILSDVEKRTAGGPYGQPLSGAYYHGLTMTGGALDNAINTPGPARGAAIALKKVLDDQMMATSPAETSRLLAARDQFHNFRTVEDALKEAKVGDQIDPRRFLDRVIKDNPSIVREGGGDQGQLGKVGQLMEEANVGDHGSMRWIRHLGEAFSSAAAAAAGAIHGGGGSVVTPALLAAGGAVAGAGAGAIGSRVMNRPMAAESMIQRALGEHPLPWGTSLVPRAINRWLGQTVEGEPEQPPLQYTPQVPIR